MSQNVLECPKRSQNVPESPKMSQNVPKYSRNVPKCPRMSQNVSDFFRKTKTLTNVSVPRPPSRVSFKSLDSDIVTIFQAQSKIYESILEMTERKSNQEILKNLQHGIQVLLEQEDNRQDL